MTLSALLAAFVVLPAQEPQVPFNEPQGVTEPSRLAITPIIDGDIARDEWDGFAKSGGGETYLQWEPGILYVAGKVPTGHDLVISLDGKQNGWLVGKDNVEIRLRSNGSKVTVSGRLLDATNVSGPKWVELPGFNESATTATKTDGSTVSIEAALIDPGLDVLPVKENERYLVRLDVVPETSQQLEPFMPRVGTEIKLVTQRASAMPVGLNWNVENTGRTVTPGNATKIRFTFNTKEESPVKKIEIKPVGILADQSTSLGVPFPKLDKKGRAFVDYETKTDQDAPSGYHLLSGTLTTTDGAPALIQASFRIAPLVDVDLVAGKIDKKTVAQTVKIPFIIKSNSTRRLDGYFDVGMPSSWEVLKGNEKNFIIYNSRAGVRRVLTVTIPANTGGVFPIRFRTQIGQRTFEQVRWLSIGK